MRICVEAEMRVFYISSMVSTVQRVCSQLTRVGGDGCYQVSRTRFGIQETIVWFRSSR